MSIEQNIIEHERRFAGMPALPAAVGASFPAMDGDVAELDELADRVIAGIGAGAVCIDDDIYEQMCWWFNLSSWPTDRVAEMLADWPQRIIDGVTGQVSVA